MLLWLVTSNESVISHSTSFMVKWATDDWYGKTGQSDVFQQTQIFSTLKRKCCRFGEIFGTGCSGRCQDNFQGRRWSKFNQNDAIFVTVYITDITVIFKIVWFNTLRPTQNGRYFPDDIFKCIFLKENVWIPIKISLKFVPKSPINNIPALV